VIVRRWVEGADERLDGSSFISRNLRKVFPDHWSFMLGEIALYSFLLLVLTGTFLSFFYLASNQPVTYTGPYQPLKGQTVSSAYDSVMRLSFEIRAGLVMRQIHHWAALVFMGAVIAHIIRVFFTGAFRKPREISWLIGIGLFLSGIGAGFTGYSLPDDALSGAGLRIAYSIILSIPFVGTWLAYLFFGGEFPGPDILNRLLVLHIFIIPLAIFTLLGAHLAVVWHQTHTQFRALGRTEDTVTGTPVWPKFALKSIGLAFTTFGVIALLGGLFQVNPIWLYGPFVPYSTASPSQPDYYVGWLEGLLRLWPNWEFHVFGHTIGELLLPGLVVPGLLFTILGLWPFLEARVSGDHEWHHFAQHPREAPVRSAFGAAGVAFFVVLVLAGGNDVVAKFLGIEVDSFNTILRWTLFLGPALSGSVTYWICRDLRDRPLHPLAAPPRVTFRRNAAGGFEEIESQPPVAEQVREEPDRT
jgi:ubiquinol-cytochrome c reductase cytochrome b subunit